MDIHHSQKQKHNLLNLHPVVSPDIHQSNQPHRRITPFVKRHFYTQRAVTIGVIATVGLSTAVVQAIQYHPLASQASESKQSQSTNSWSTITTHIDTSQGLEPIPAVITHISNQPSASTKSISKSQVIINGENIPVPEPSGTITRSYSSNNSQTNITVKIDNDSSSTHSSSDSSSNRVSIRSSSNSSSKFTNNTARGSP